MLVGFSMPASREIRAAHGKTGVWNTPVPMTINPTRGDRVNVLVAKIRPSASQFFVKSLLGPFSKGPNMKAAYRLTDDDAVDVWLRHWRGEYQHHIAAAYGVNSARINDVLKERTHVGSKQRAATKYPE
jgi:hypothetical protein